MLYVAFVFQENVNCHALIVCFENNWPQFIHVNVACTLIKDIFDNFSNFLRCLVLVDINAQI